MDRGPHGTAQPITQRELQLLAITLLDEVFLM